MKKNIRQKKNHERLETLIHFFKSLKNPMKKGELSEMLQRDDFHNKQMTEEEYQKEQKDWLENVNRKRKEKAKRT